MCFHAVYYDRAGARRDGERVVDGVVESHRAAGGSPEDNHGNLVTVIPHSGDISVAADRPYVRILALFFESGEVLRGIYGIGNWCRDVCVHNPCRKKIDSGRWLSTGANGRPATTSVARLHSDGGGVWAFKRIPDVVMPQRSRIGDVGGRFSKWGPINHDRPVVLLLVQYRVDRSAGARQDIRDHDVLNVVVKEEPSFLPTEALRQWVGIAHCRGTKLSS